MKTEQNWSDPAKGVKKLFARAPPKKFFAHTIFCLRDHPFFHFFHFLRDRSKRSKLIILKIQGHFSRRDPKIPGFQGHFGPIRASAFLKNLRENTPKWRQDCEWTLSESTNSHTGKVYGVFWKVFKTFQNDQNRKNRVRAELLILLFLVTLSAFVGAALFAPDWAVPA